MADDTVVIDDLERILLTEGQLEPQRAEELQALLGKLSLKNTISLLERLGPNRAALVLRLLPRARSYDAFDALDSAHQAELVDALGDAPITEFFGSLDPDDRVALLDELPAEIAQRLMQTLAQGQRDVTGVVLGYPKRSIGRRMSPQVPMVGLHDTVATALDRLREQAADAESIYTVPVVTSDRKLVGVTSLRTLFTADPDERVEELMSEPEYAHAADNDEETARWFLPLDYLALPIVDDSDRLVGMLTVDDAFDIVEEADNEDAARGGGAEPLQQPYLTTAVVKLVRSRIVWLGVLAVSALLTVQVLDAFEEALQAAVVLSLFIPLLTGTGGNTGNQAATTVTRALALGDVRKKDVFKVLWRELRVGALLGLLLGVAFGLLLGAIYGASIGLVLGLTLTAVCTLAASVGGIMPLLAKAIGADPAVFSNPFITTFVDATGLILYFLIARAVLGI
ncbi:magnesium transporter [Corynebacterium yudongzhengii]|uniref:Magnesium transporter MgtE n=1 Tax=Corynebacterium yudongzhengii TaxID=2080740 RepID=A0A2U1T5K5_9CORY|nr:magnesium transporter [Corynebacterium yudongzhengii]AWB81041.1 magnesium transporter [Corynebacterium yudongzhengii]PWC01286.1 magnesium transporter [Corynebacterium yudongzhengii]